MSRSDASDPRKDLGRRLAILRESRDLNQADLARQARITPSSLSLYEAGKKAPELATLFRILEALDYGLAALDRAGEFCIALRLTPTCRCPSEPAEPLRGEIANLAGEASSAVSRLTDAVALLAGTEWVAERVRATALNEGYPLPEDRAKAAELWEKLRKYPHEVRRAFVAEFPDFHLWSLAELLSHASEDAASEDAIAALDLAHLALDVAELIPGDEAWRARVVGYALGHLANAQRVKGHLQAAKHSFARSDKEWKVGEGSPKDLLSEARLLDLKSSLRRAERKLPEALNLLDRALSLGRLEVRGRILIKKAKVFEELDQLDSAITTLQEAEPHIDAERERRLWLCLRHNLLDYLSKIHRYQEAEDMLPEVRALSQKHGKELDRVRLRWAEGRIAVGLGRIQEGIDFLTQVRAEFVSRKIWFDAALVTLELAVVFLQQGRADMVKTLAAHLAPIFQSNGVHREAMAALTLFRKAAEQQKVTLEMARSLVAWLRKAQHDPNLKLDTV